MPVAQEVAEKKIGARLLLNDARGRPILLAASFVVVVCVSILGIEGWQLIAARSAAIAERETAATNLAKSLAEQASSVFLQADLRLSGVVERLGTDGVGASNVARIQRLFQADMVRLPQVQRLFVVDAEGRYITTDLTQPIDRTVPHADREYFVYHQTHDDDGPHLGPPIRSRMTNQWVVTISRRFTTADGRFAGVVGASVDLGFFNRYYEQFDIGKHGTILLAMTNGTILDRRPFRDNVIGTSLADGPLFRDHIALNEVGTSWIRSRIDGIVRLTAYRKLSIFPAYAIVSLSKDEILGEWARDSVVHATAALLLVSILAFIGAKLVSQVARRHADQQLLLQSRLELQLVNMQLETLARVDGLTGLANRREFDRVFHEEVSRLRRNGGALALLMLDVDHFKAYNDSLGHPQGDACLRMVANLIKERISRPGDLSARYGGEEFVVLLPSTDARGALALAEQIRQRIRQGAMPHPNGVDSIVTVSIGIGLLGTEDAHPSTEMLLARADKALYAAKASGRDAIRLYMHGDERESVFDMAVAPDIAVEEA